MNLNIKGKRALVMGASSGLGKAVAQSLAAEGVRVAICAREKSRLEKTAQEIGAEFSFACDLNKEGSAVAAVRAATERLGGIDILVVNTGGPPKGDFSEVTMEQWKESFQGLWLSSVEALQMVLPSMKNEGWGRILFVTSVAAKEPMSHLTVSNGLRAGLLGLIKSISQEYARFGITINGLMPGYTRTERLKELGVDEQKMAEQIPAGRLGMPEEFGSLAAFLASENAAYITGQSIACDGGYLKGY